MLLKMELPIENSTPKLKRTWFKYVIRAIEFIYETVYFHFLPYLTIFLQFDLDKISQLPAEQK